MHKPTRLALALAFALPHAAWAEDPAPSVYTYEIHAANDANEHADAWKRWAEDYARGLRSSLGTTFGARLAARTVKGAPYSAEVVTEVNQTLGDGNVISRRTQGAVYRDGEGRTRQESGGDGASRTVYIQDPVEKKSIVLAPGTKKAVVSGLHTLDMFERHGHPPALVKNGNRQVVRVDDTEVRVEDGKVFLNGREVPESAVNLKSRQGREIRVQDGRVTIDGKEIGSGPGSGSRVIVNRVQNADGRTQEEVQVRVVRMGDDADMPMPPVPPVPPVPGVPAAPPAPPAPMAAPLPPMPPMPPMPGIQTLRFESTAKLGKGVTTSLGTRDFDGVKAEGKQTTWVIPAGEIGNRKPIDVVSETWYSPELQVTVYSRYNDPRTGETVYRLSGIKRAEPSPDLFKVPDGVAVTDKAHGHEKVKIKVKEKASG